MQLLIDADPIVYMMGFAAQQTYYDIEWCNVSDPDDPFEDHIFRATFKLKKRLDQYVELLNLHPDEINVQVRYVAEPLAHALHLVNTKLRNVELAVNGVLRETGHSVEGRTLYLTSGAENYRNWVATLKRYKGNRDKLHKPIHYQAIRDYMTEKLEAIVVVGAEADDALAIAQYAAPSVTDTVICTIDKDLQMVPGFHYNYDTGKEAHVNELDGTRFFYKQIVTGDATDNIGGVYRMGEKSAPVKAIMQAETEQDMYDIALGAYAKTILAANKNCLYTHMTPEAALLENARLLWMQEHYNERWQPPGTDMSHDTYPDDFTEGSNGWIEDSDGEWTYNPDKRGT